MANPLTCRHNIISPAFDPETNEAYIVCASCDTKLDRKYLEGRKYEFDIDHNVWVRNAKHR